MNRGYLDGRSGGLPARDLVRLPICLSEAHDSLS